MKSFAIFCILYVVFFCFFFSSRRRHTRYWRDWSSDVCSSDLLNLSREVQLPGPLDAVGDFSGNLRREPAVLEGELGSGSSVNRGAGWPGELVREEIGRASCRERV